MDAKLSWKERIEDIEKLAIQKQNKEQLALIRKFKLGRKLDSNEKVFLLQEQKPYWYEIKNKSDAYDLNWLLKYGYNAENINESFLVAKSFLESGFIDSYCLRNNIKINTKSLFIYGKYDKITSKNQFTKVKNQFPNNTLIVIDSCGHFPHIERKSKLIKILTENIN